MQFNAAVLASPRQSSLCEAYVLSSLEDGIDMSLNIGYHVGWLPRSNRNYHVQASLKPVDHIICAMPFRSTSERGGLYIDMS